MADVQTKRMMRRTNSNSSVGSSVTGSIRGYSDGQPERKGSSVLMRERSFRDHPPNRESHLPNSQDTPSVPTIPKNTFSSVPEQSPKRVTSIDLPTANIASPPSTGPGNLGSAQVTQSHKASGFGQRISSLSSVDELTGLERPDSRGSVNFSYPTTSGLSPYGQRQLTSSTTQSGSQKQYHTTKKGLVYDPNTRRLLPEAELLFYTQHVQDIANRPVKKKRTVQNAAGTHIADGTIGGRIRGTAIDSTKATSRPDQQIETAQHSPNAATIKAPIQNEGASGNVRNKRDQPSASECDSDSSGNVKHISTRGGTFLSKKPSIVREERELEEAEDDLNRILSQKAVLSRLEFGVCEDRSVSPSPPSSPLSLRAGLGRDKVLAPAINPATPQHSQSVIQPAHRVTNDPKYIAPPETPSPDQNNGIVDKTARVQSVSPVRSAHFLATPENLSTIHQPPPRSVSPRKSAMKQSATSRDGSPIGDVPAGQGIGHVQSLSEISDTSTAISDERNVAKKKSVRVSFDDDSNVVLGQDNTGSPADSPLTATSQNSRGWLSTMGRGRGRDFGSADNLDETMQPRPALPSFGSIRERRGYDIEERPLVKPTKSTGLTSSQSTFTTSTSEPAAYFASHSSDHALGSLLSQSQTLKCTPVVSRGREPLPPEVTSVEGSGYVSDNDSSIYSLDLSEPHIRSDNVDPTQVNKPSCLDRAASNPPIGNGHDISLKANGNGNIPSFAVTQATPTLESSESKREWPSIPGEFPSSDSNQNDSLTSTIDDKLASPAPALPRIFEPGPASAHKTAIENSNPYPWTAEETESDGDSIYSDAAEDLSDLGGDGFLSLDAVMESPFPLSIPGLALTTPPDSPNTQTIKSKVYQKAILSQDSDKLEIGENSDNAKGPLREVDETSEAESGPNPRQKRVTVRLPEKDLQSSRPGSRPEPPRSQDRTNMSTRGVETKTDIHSSILKPSVPNVTSSDKTVRKSPTIQPKATLEKKYGPIFSPPPVVSLDLTEDKLRSRNSSYRTNSSTVKQDISTPVPTLRRSASGDSESSFKRTRSAGRGYTMKKSMRDAERRTELPRSEASTLRSSRFSLRSLSPSGSRLSNVITSPPVSLSQKTMRKSQTLQNQLGTPTLRSTASERAKPALHVPGFSTSRSESKGRVRPIRVSRIVDSSDDEDVRPSFRSRFVDSSDEEDVPDLRSMVPTSSASLRYITHQTGAVDNNTSSLPVFEEKSLMIAKPGSSTLENITSTKGDNTPSSNLLQRSGSGRDYIGSTAMASITEGSSSKPENKRRSSIMSVLRRKRPDASSKIRKSELESATRRDTPLERSRSDLLAVRHQESNLSTGSGASGPKLQKRRGPKWAGKENWLLQRFGNNGDQTVNSNGPEVRTTQQDAGNSMGVLPTASGPETTDQYVKASGLANVDLSAVLPAKKHRRFQMMRRAFGLDN